MAGERLFVSAGAAVGGWLLVARETLLGQSATGEGRLAGDPYLAAQHALVYRDSSGGLQLEPLDREHAVRVNRERLRESRLLEIGDEVALGETKLVVTPGAWREDSAAALWTDPVLDFRKCQGDRFGSILMDGTGRQVDRSAGRPPSPRGRVGRCRRRRGGSGT